MSYFCLIFTLAEPWDTCPRKPFIQQVAKKIEYENGFILCIEPTALSIHTLIFYPNRIIKWFRGEYRFRNVENNIFSFSPYTLEHIIVSIRFKPLLWLNKFFLKYQLKKKLKKISVNSHHTIFVLHRPELHFLIGLLNEKGGVYDCQDDFCLTSRMVKIKVAGNVEREKILCEKCNFVTVTSRKLLNRNKKYNENTFLMYNGYSSNVFDNFIYNKIPLIEKSKYPRVGYIGTIRDWFDFDLLDFLISNRPDWTFLFIGRLKKESHNNFSLLEMKYKNIISIKNISYSEYPNYLKYFDVGVIPFKTNEFMESVNPNKLYEYFGCGVPVVSTDIGDIKKDYFPFAKVGTTKEEILKLIDEVIDQSSKMKLNFRENIKEFGKKFTWENSAEEFYSYIKKYIKI